MKMILALLLLLVSIASPLCAEWDEVPELQPEQLQEDWLEQFYREMTEDKAILNANSRMRFGEDTRLSFGSFHYERKELLLTTNLYEEKGLKPMLGMNAAYRARGKDTRELMIGAMHCSWGLGNILGKGNRNQMQFRVSSATHPLYASPIGAAGSYQRGKLSAFVLASGQKRCASLSDNRIKTLYSSTRNRLSGVGEAIVAGGIDYTNSALWVGLLAYYQGYRLDFCDPELEKNLPAFSFGSAYKYGVHGIKGEISALGNDPAMKLQLESQPGKLDHKLGFYYFRGMQIPAYAARPSLLSSKGGRHEWHYDLDWEAAKGIDISISQALSRQNHALHSQSWMGRSILALNCKYGGTSALLQFTRLDKELLVQQDSSFIVTLPVHYRGLLKLGRRITDSWNWDMQFRYNYEEKLQSHNNSFYWRSSLAWEYEKLMLGAGVKTWQSLRTMILPDEDSSDAQGYTMASGDDNRVFLKARYKLARIRLSAEMEQSWLNGQRSLYISLGI